MQIIYDRLGVDEMKKEDLKRHWWKWLPIFYDIGIELQRRENGKSFALFPVYSRGSYKHVHYDVMGLYELL